MDGDGGYARLGFGLLGPLQVLADDRPVDVEGARQRIVLAMLMLELGQVIPVDRLVEAVWGERPPRTARNQIQFCVSALRRMFTELAGCELIRTRPSGYLLNTADDTVDVRRFHRLVARARVVAGHDLAAAARDLRLALGLWRGDAAADVDSRLVQAVAARLNEERSAVHEECIGLELRLGRHREVIAELSELVATYPLREKLRAQLMLALYRAGRPGDALAAYRDTRETLAEKLGLDPTEELRALEQAILENDDSLNLPEGSAPGPPTVAPVVPRQLPHRCGTSPAAPPSWTC